MKLRDFIPPILTLAAKNLRRSPRPEGCPPASPRATFPTYNDALKECETFGYEAANLVQVVFHKTVAYRDALLKSPPQITPSDSLALFAVGLALRSTAPITVLDFGGACGAHYFRMRTLLRPDVRLRWHVIETPAMAKAAIPIHTEELSFSDSLHEVRKSLDHIDIVFSSGTLQCVPNPHEILKQLLDCRASYLVLPRLGLSETTADVITVHEARLSDNGPGPMPAGIQDGTTRYPFTFPARTAIETSMMNEYEIILSVADPSGVFAVNQEPLLGLGYVARAKAFREHRNP